jgi:hypothetical protein
VRIAPKVTLLDEMLTQKVTTSELGRRLGSTQQPAARLSNLAPAALAFEAQLARTIRLVRGQKSIGLWFDAKA